MKTIRILKMIARIFVGLVFICSAILKMKSIDAFEIYVFSFKVFNFDIASVFARLLIGMEFFIGIMLIIRLYFKQIWYTTFGILLAFTGFLAVLTATGSQENCHCFGSSFDLSPANSIVKNVILLALLLFCKQETSIKIKYQKAIVISLLALSFVSPFVLSVPDFLYKPISTPRFEQNKFTDVIRENDTLAFVAKGKRLVCFFGTGCRFCKLTAKKISIFQERNDIPSDKIFYAFWGTEKTIVKFLSETYTQPDVPYYILSTKDFMDITGGSMPLIVCLDNNRTVKIFKYRNMDEKWITDFLQGE